MPGIKFDFTGDAAGFIKTVEQVQASVQHTSRMLGEVGKYFDVDSVIKQVEALTMVIRTNEETINHSKQQVAEWMKQAEEARKAGDFATFDAKQLDITQAIADMKTYQQDLDDTRKALNELLNLQGTMSGEKAPMLFDTQEEYDHVQQMRAGIAELQSQISQFSGPDEEMEELRSQLSASEEELNKCELAAANNAKSLGSVGSFAAEASKKYYQLTNSIKEQVTHVATLNAQLKKSKEDLANAKVSGNAGDIESARMRIDAYSKALQDAKMHLINLQTEQKNMGDRMKSLANTVNASGSKIAGVFKQLAAVAGIGFGLSQAKQFGMQIMAVRGQFQQLEVAFKTMLGSEEKAVGLMEQLTKTAAITPFDLQGVTQGAKQLLAYGISADKVNDTLIHLGDIAAGLSLPLGDLVYLYGTTMTQGRMFTQDLRQFMGRGIPIAEELAKQFGVTKDEVGKLVTAGKVGAEEFNKAIMAMSSEGGKFAGLMEAQSKTISGQISNIGDAIDSMFNNMGKQSEGIINGTLSVVSSLVENYETVGKVIADLVATYGVYKAAVMTVTAIQALQTAGVGALTAAETVHYGWLVLCEKAQKMLNATMLANPYVLAATAIAGLVEVMVTMKSEQERVNEAYDEYNSKKADIIKQEEEHKARIEELARVAGDESLSTDTRRLALVELEQKYPSIFAKYDTEAEKLKHIRDLKAEIAALDGKNSITDAGNELESVNKRIAELEKKEKWSIASTNSYAGTLKSGRIRNNEEEAELSALLRRRAELTNQIKKEEGNAYLTNLTGVSNEDLKKQIEERRNLITKMDVSGKMYGKVKLGGASGVYTKDELQGQMQILESEQNRRKKLLEDSTKDFIAEADKVYKKELASLKKLESLTDPKKRSKSTQVIDGKKVNEMSSNEFLAAVQKQQLAVTEARKIVDAYKIKGAEKEAANEAEHQAKEKQQAQKHAEEMVKMEQDAARAREDASIAAIQSQAQREHAEREAQHRRTIEDIKARQEDIYKQIYQERKTAYETKNAGKENVTPYVLTDEGSRYWQGLMHNSLASVQEAEKQILRELGKGEIMESLQQQFGKGNVDVLARPLIDAAELAKKGWKDAGEGIATVFSSQFGIDDSDGNVHEILVTPILPDGTVLSEDELKKYIDTTLQGADDILKADNLGIVIAVDVDEDGSAGEKLHKLHEELIDLPTDKIREIQALFNSIDPDPALAALHEIQQGFDNIDPSKLEETFKRIDNISLSNLTEEENQKLRLALQKMASDAATGNANYARLLEERKRAEKQATIDLLKQWGDYEQQKQAIIDEYEEKISKAQSAAEQANLMLQRDKEVEDIGQKNLMESVDWEGVFSDLQGHTAEYLEGLRQQLQDLLSSGNVTDVTQMATIREKIVEINAELDKEKGFWSLIGEKQREHNRLLEEADNAWAEATDAQVAQWAAEDDVKYAKNDINQLLKEQGRSETVEGNRDELSGIFAEGTKEYEKMTDLLAALYVAESNLGKARTATLSATEKATKKEDQAKKKTAEKVADFFDGIVTSKSFQNLESLPGLLDELGLGEKGEKVSKGLSAANDAAGAAADFASGNYIGAAMKAVSAVKNVVGIFGGASDTRAEADAIIGESNGILANIDKNVNRIASGMKDSYGAEAISKYKELLGQYRNMGTEYNRQIQAAGNAKYGTKHIEWWWRNRNGGEGKGGYVDRIRKLFGMQQGGYGTAWQGFFNQLQDMGLEGARVLATLRDNAQKFGGEWAELWHQIDISGSDDEGRIATAASAWADTWAQYEESTKEFRETLAGTSFDSVFDDFMDRIYDFANGSEEAFDDVGDAWQKMVNRMVVNNFLAQSMKNKLQAWYDKFTRAYDDKSISEGELDDLRDEYMDIVEEGKREAERLREMGIVGDVGDASRDQSATARSIETITHEQANALEAILTGMQLSQAQNNMKVDEMASNIQVALVTMKEATRVMATEGTLLEMRDLMVTGNRHLADINEVTAKQYRMLDEKLNEVVRTIKETA